MAIDFIKYVKLRADEIGCNRALYNHHGWFGNPYNQVEIIERLPEDSFENEMINVLRDEGFDGPWGILGHIKSEDVQKVLERNMNGLKSLRPRTN